MNHSDRIIDVAIIGAGIGGAAAAVALRQAGFEVEVFEQTAELREVGGALVLRDPSLELFRQWGVAEAIESKMVRVKQIELRTTTGKIIGQMPMAVSTRESHLTYPIHRADVHNALASQIPSEHLHLGHRLATVTELENCVEATFENGNKVRAKLLIGADGLRSIVRKLIDATPLTFIGLVTNRTIAPASVLPANMPNDRMRFWMSKDLQV